MVRKGLSLAEDEWVHRDALHEWWYVNSHLTDQVGRRFGAVISFFPDYMLFGLADKQGRRMARAEVLRGRRLASVRTGVKLNGNYFLGAGSPGSYSLRYTSADVALDLSLEATKDPMLVNGMGKIREGLLGDSWYYALTSVSASGRLLLDGEERKVSGVAWVDRQWGRWEDMGIGGWEWFSLQFSNGCEVLATQIYSPVTRRPCSKVMTLKRKDSSGFHSENFSIRRVESWTSGSSGLAYGKRWTLVSPGVLDVAITVDFEEQEFHRGFWEGCCSFEGTLEGERVTGVGYSEQVDRSPGPLAEKLSLIAAPGHYVLQNLFGRANLGLWDLSERLRLWRILTVRRRWDAWEKAHSVTGSRPPSP